MLRHPFAMPHFAARYKFTVSKTREGETSSIISEFFLSDQKGEELSLKDASVVAAFTVAQATVDDPVNLIDNDASTSSSLAFNQPVVVRVNPGHSVGGFGFKTTADEAKIGNDPTSFKLEGSMDGSTWYLLNVKTDYDTPKKRGALVGPFVVSQLTAMALGNHTLPAEAMPDKDSKPFEPAARVTPAPAPAPEPVPVPVPAVDVASVESTPEATPFTAPVMPAPPMDVAMDVAPVAPPLAPVAPVAAVAGSAVTQAVVAASAATGLDKADQAATAAAADHATLHNQVVAAASSAGLTPEQVKKIESTLASIEPSHWNAVLKAWGAMASSKVTTPHVATAEEKVAAVVDATAGAGFTVAQLAHAAAESALPAALKDAQVTTTGNIGVVGRALQGTEMEPEGKAAIADAAAKESPDNQEAIADVLIAAGVMPTTTTPEPAEVDLANADARVIVDAVSAKLEDAPISPQEKVNLAKSAAEEYLKVVATTTSFDGVGMVVKASEDAGLKPEQVSKIATEAETLTAAEQVAVATAMRAASEGVEVLHMTGVEPAQKVSAVVQAEAVAGVSDSEQASSASIAVAAAAEAARKAHTAEVESEVLKRVVSAAQKAELSDAQAEAVLEVVAAMPSDAQEAIATHLSALTSPMQVAAAVPVAAPVAPVAAEPMPPMGAPVPPLGAEPMAGMPSDGSMPLDMPMPPMPMGSPVPPLGAEPMAGMPSDGSMPLDMPLPSSESMPADGPMPIYSPHPTDYTTHPTAVLPSDSSMPLDMPLPTSESMPADGPLPGHSLPTASASQFMFGVVPGANSRAEYQAQTGMQAKGFVFGVSLNVQGLVKFINAKTGAGIADPRYLSLAYGRFSFDWPTQSCSEEESGFTDFQSITFYNATFANPGDSCGTLLATTMDLDGVVRFPKEGDNDLFLVSGMFGTKHLASGGDSVSLSIVDLVVFHYTEAGKVEYSVCGDPTVSSYVGCPELSPLKIKYPKKNLGQGVKLCSGQAHFHEYKLEHCFDV
ncbi:unnamed protein product [Effrenium voratum]|nr:unnamed protein product [Effrenium voratum]